MTKEQDYRSTDSEKNLSKCHTIHRIGVGTSEMNPKRHGAEECNFATPLGPFV